MKTLGTTIEGNYIVEMTADEHWSFHKVEASINGKSFDYIHLNRFISDTNLAPVFRALDDLSETKISINQIKEYVNFLDKALGAK